jgi:hypothetical protein
MSCNKKIVVFDLDETLGYFMELGMFWDSLKYYIKYKSLTYSLNQQLFDKILDIFPEFLRPDIFNILNYLKDKKEANHCNKLMIYTNNQGPEEWAKCIMTYFENKLNSKIFDQIIAAFKVQGKRVELCRTTHLKTHSDLIKCTKLPPETQICFLDDVFYPDMSNNNIYYINVKPYVHDLDFNIMIDRFINSNIMDITNNDEFKKFILTNMKKYNYICIPKNELEISVDKTISKKIFQHLQSFFKIAPIKNNTKKRRNFRNRTFKRRRPGATDH